MAQVIRLGVTPFWGTVASKEEAAGILIDSVNYSTEVKDYEQQNHIGAIKGYLIYDQTVSFDISGTMLWDDGLNAATTCKTAGLGQTWNNPFKIGAATSSACNTLKDVLNFVTGWQMTSDCVTNPNVAIIKNNSFNTSAGGAATFSASGTVYDFT